MGRSTHARVAGTTLRERDKYMETMVTPEPQRLKALARANKVRLARAELKRRIADADVSAADVILDCPSEAASWSVGELLMSQRRWGTNRCRKFLARNQISEIKPIGTLTERQRNLLADQLRSCEQFSASIETGPELQHSAELAFAVA
jgi:hypothetical protein